MNDDDVLYYLGFSHFLGIGPVRFNNLMNQYSDVKKAYLAPLPELKELIGIKTAEKFHQFRQTNDLQKIEQNIAEKNIHIVTKADKYFPTALREIPDPPICLYVKGDITKYNFTENILVSVIGTRKPTAYGQLVTQKLTKDLSISGCVIVSGMALGIDTIAHESALEMKGQTIAILGCGVDIVYPRENQTLYNKIIASGGLIMSEFPPGMTVLPGLFVARNRLISGLSRGVLVVEGLIDSGSLITARYAAQQGKEVFAPPSPINSALSEAPNLLIKEGAKFITCVEDILEEFQLPNKAEIHDTRTLLSNLEQKVYDQLIIEARTADELAINCELSVYKILPIMSAMEIQGVIEKNMEGKYQLKV